MNMKEKSLPSKQLAILSVCRFAEPVALTGVFPYLPEMIESFNIPKNEVAKWAGITSAVFSMAQCVVSISWGRASDRFGRKPIILICLTCAMATSLLFGFSQSLTMAIVARALSGASNGNVGILRTTVAELVPQKELQPKAFSIMPLVWSVGSVFGPMLGGALASPAQKFPSIFGNIEFFHRFPFALPNLVASVFFTVGIVTGSLFFKETLKSKKHRYDPGLALGNALTRSCSRRKHPKGHKRDDEFGSLSSFASRNEDKETKAHSYRDVFSPQSNFNLLTYTFLAFHAVTFDQLLPVFLHYPQQDNSTANKNVRLPLKFAGGFGLDSGRIGVLFTAFGIIQMIAQFAIFPVCAKKYGVLFCLRVCTFVFPIAYILVPFTVLMPTPLSQQVAVFVVMLIKGIGSIFAFPCVTILLTNSARSLALLGTLNGVAVATSAIGRATGPFIGGRSFTLGVDIGYVILPWWILAAFAIAGHLCTWLLIEMDGFGGGDDDPEEVALTAADEDAEGDTGHSSAILVGGSSIDDDDDAIEEDDPLLLRERMDRTSTRSRDLKPDSAKAPSRLSSPIGFRETIGPGGQRLSNGIGQNMSGLGSGGSAYH